MNSVFYHGIKNTCLTWPGQQYNSGIGLRWILKKIVKINLVKIIITRLKASLTLNFLFLK